MASALPILAVPFTAGDRLPVLVGTVVDTNLTSKIVRLTLARPEPDGVLVKDATIVDAAQGTFSFAWDAGDIVAGVGQVAVLQLIDDTGLALTLLRFQLDIGGLPTP